MKYLQNTLYLTTLWALACSGPQPLDSGEDTHTGPSDDTDSDTDTDAPNPQMVRFIALGDGGTGSPRQFTNARAIRDVCALEGCQFALYMGDNFYDDGVSSINDVQWQDKFEIPYAELDFPFYAALGNHDNGGFGGAGFEFWRGDIQVDYAASGLSDKFMMPDRYYSFRPEDSPVEFFALDTNAMMWDSGLDEQGAWLDDAIQQSTAPFKIAFGHHPYRSNGQHGNAGKYEGIPGIPILSGEDIQDFMETHVIGTIDMYLCGHDHNRQWLASSQGTELVVSGAAAKTTDLKGRGNTTFFEDDTAEGFFWVEVTEYALTGRFYNSKGELEYEQTLTF